MPFEVITNASTGQQTIREFSQQEEDSLLAIKRASAKLPLKQFCLNVKNAGILTGPDTVQAAKGNLPVTFKAMLIAGGADADEVEIIWATTVEVWRNDPLIQILANTLGASTADALFGIN